MPRRPSADSPTPMLDLHPVLQTTLQYMDVRLEDELARYRRARRRSPVQSRWGEGQPMVPPVVAPMGVPAPEPELGALAIAPNRAADLNLEPSLVPGPMEEQPSGSFVPPSPDPYGTSHDDVTASYPDYLESSEHLLRGLTEDEV